MQAWGDSACRTAGSSDELCTIQIQLVAWQADQLGNQAGGLLVIPSIVLNGLVQEIRQYAGTCRLVVQQASGAHTLMCLEAVAAELCAATREQDLGNPSSAIEDLGAQARTMLRAANAFTSEPDIHWDVKAPAPSTFRIVARCNLHQKRWYLKGNFI
eukprot:1158273-Pelagomonas_calceolata.AAC.14